LKFALDLEPSNPIATGNLAWLYLVTGRSAQALALFESPAYAGSGPLATAYAWSGRETEARGILANLESHPTPLNMLSIGTAYLVLGETDRGFDWLGRAVARRAGPARWFNVHPGYDRWRHDPRFVALVEQLHLPAVDGERH